MNDAMASEGPMQPGKILGGDFVIERPLGAGGMGAVYVAQQRSTERLRAIKTMHPRLLSDPSMRARFAREAKVSSMIESDHVVEVLAAGIDEESDTPWIAMELLQGDDLARYVAKRGRLSNEELRAVAEQFGHALVAAHRAGVVHRDLKPANLFLATARRAGVPFTLKVLDFGIAKILDSQTSKATTNIIGSPLWMAPEQTDASAPIGPWTDLWTFGLIMFWALTGKSYWRAANASEGSIPAVIRELVVDPVASASERATFLGVGDRVPPGFDAWLARCLQRDVTARFGSAAEAVSALLAVLQGSTQRMGTAVPATVAMPQFPMGGGPAAPGVPVAMPMAPGVPTAAPMAAPMWSGTSQPEAWRPPTAPPPDLTLAPMLHPLAQPLPARRSKAPLIAFMLILAIAFGAGAWTLASKPGPAPETPRATVSAAPVAPAVAPIPVAPAPAPTPLPPKPAAADAGVAVVDAGAPVAPTEPEPRSSRRRSRRSRNEPVAPVPGGPPPVVLPHREPAPAPTPQHCDVRAGPLWSNAQAQQSCQGVCQSAGARRYTGQWHTTVPGVMSVCTCEYPAGSSCPR